MVEGIPFLDNDTEIATEDLETFSLSIAHTTPVTSGDLTALGINDRYGVHVDEPGTCGSQEASELE